MDGDMASIGTYAVSTCYQEILSEVEENGEGIQEILDVLEDGSVIGGVGGESGVIQTENYPDFYPASSNEVIKSIHITINTVTILYLLRCGT